jgi:CrcB protein
VLEEPRLEEGAVDRPPCYVGSVRTSERLMWLAAAGAVGTLARYGLSGLVQRLHDGSFPYGTLAVNLIGCFLFGLVWTLAEERLVISGATRLVLLVGFMGAFTTFSTYAFESAALLRDAEWLTAAANVLAHNALGLVALFCGVAVGRAVI